MFVYSPLYMCVGGGEMSETVFLMQFQGKKIYYYYYYYYNYNYNYNYYY